MKNVNIKSFLIKLFLPVLCRADHVVNIKYKKLKLLDALECLITFKNVYQMIKKRWIHSGFVRNAL